MADERLHWFDLKLVASVAPFFQSELGAWLATAEAVSDQGSAPTNVRPPGHAARALEPLVA